MSRKKEWEYLFQIVRFAMEEGPCPKAPTELDWKELYKISKFHQIQSIVAYGIDKLPYKNQIPEEVRQKFQKAWQLETAQDTMQMFAGQELLQAMEAAHVEVCPLKGYYIKQFYPRPELRSMADLDILYHSKQEVKMEAVLEKLGYECEHKETESKTANHNAYSRKPFLHIEMHHHLVPLNSRYAAYYKNPWEKAQKEAGKEYIYRFSWEDQFIFMMAHFAKHFYEYAGGGIRHLIDIRQFEKVKGAQMDWAYIEQELEKLKLKVFTQEMRRLAQQWFDEGEISDFYGHVMAMMMESGIYGTTEIYMMQNVLKADKKLWLGQLKTWLTSIFLPLDCMKIGYPYLKKCPFLLPFAWVQRILYTCFFKKGRAMEVFSESKVDMEKTKNRQQIFDKLGL